MDNTLLFNDLKSEIIVAQYMAVYLTLLFFVQLRTGSYKTHKIPMLITLVFVVNSHIRPHMADEIFIMWHSAFIVGIAVVSWFIYHKAKKTTNVSVNVIPMLILLMFIGLHTFRPLLSHSDFMIIHGVISVIIVTVLTILPIIIHYNKKIGKTSVFEKYVY